MALNDGYYVTKRLDLFGGCGPWNSSEWTQQNDSVRGSTLFIPPSGVCAVFSGNLDTKTLGGTGFASQRTTEERIWDLSDYQGVEFLVKPWGCEDIPLTSSNPPTNKTYSFNIKDVLPDRYIENGTVLENSTLEYQANFTPSEDIASDGGRVVLPFESFEANYRGRPQNGTELNLSNIRRFSLMVRSFFGPQEGEFRLVISSRIRFSANPSFRPPWHDCSMQKYI
ncbi:NADH:ubiquinone oxidoreductase complex I intermediate-associated protein 30 [Choiromyces venosus 120613-1]|uniref:NADH:ubiquinone oxidoreductase complex I intermediate-associated protein 30 n=1 Tax=Choiromyces venosus 120613-1 TaxID=1336337 RepID=A0A3N4JW44_9PEZI|nr:NADH:ubiquinone oxidoreductase complex I intermediate-associated protein 30 [Choiromyces venosus 120613-1]